MQNFRQGNMWLKPAAYTIAAVSLLGLLFTLSFLNGPIHISQAANSNIYVRVDGSDANCDGSVDAAYTGSNGPACAKQTIQAGVNTVSTGGVVSIGPGTFVEQVEISKTLTMQGTANSPFGPSVTIIQSPITLTNAFTSTTGDPNKAIVYIHDAANVSLDRIAVDGAGQGSATNYRFEGITFHNASGQLSNSTITHIRNTPLDGAQSGTGFYAYNSDNISRTIMVDYNNISDYQKNGITFVGNGLSGNINGNMITGTGQTTVTAQNGIEVAFGATASISSNRVSDNFYTGDPTYDASGLLLYQTPPQTVNVVYNTFSGNGDDILIDSVPSYNIHDNTLNGTTSASGHNSYGINFYSDSTASVGTVISNTITGHNYGIGAYTYPVTDTTAVITATYNRIVGNGVGIDSSADITDNVASSAVTANHNWWGCNTGPNTTGCDTTAGPITTTNWLILKASASAISVYINNTAIISGTIIFDNNNANSQGYVPYNTPVTFTVVPGNAGSVSPTSTVIGRDIGNNGIATTTFTAGNIVTNTAVQIQVDNQVVTTTINILCNTALVTGSGDANSCGSLRYALSNPPASGVISITSTSIQLDNSLVITGPITISGASCNGVPSLTLTKSNAYTSTAPAVQISNGVHLQNIKISGFPGTGLKALPGGNVLKCVVVTKGP